MELAKIKKKSGHSFHTIGLKDHFAVVCLVAWPLNENEAGIDLVLINLPAFLMSMMLFSSSLVGIYITKVVRFLSKQNQLQPLFHSKARQLWTHL